LGEAVRVCVEAGAAGITVHPRADERHITRRDVLELSVQLRSLQPSVEFNIEGDPRADLLDLVEQVRPTQCTLVPVIPGEITSQASPCFESVARDVLRQVGYTSPELGIDADRCRVEVSISEQAGDIALGVVESDPPERLGAGDQGLMFG
ncbi:MAG: pyridoxine 5'-phosphate synthase, partial [Planctomycetota bacterium]